MNPFQKGDKVKIIATNKEDIIKEIKKDHLGFYYYELENSPGHWNIGAIK